MKPHHSGNKNSLGLSRLALNDYESIYVIDAADDSYVEYNGAKSDSQLVVHGYGDNFFLDIAAGLREQVWEEDRSYFIRTFNKAAIMDSQRQGKNFSMRFRLDVGGSPMHYVLKTIRSSDHSIILGIMNIETQVQRELASESERIAYMEIAESLASLFEVIYHVDIATGYFTICKGVMDASKSILTQGSGDFFEWCKSYVPEHVHPDDCDLVLRELNREKLLATLQSSGTISLTYRRMIDSKPRYVRLFAFRQRDTGRLVLGVRNVDMQMRRENAGETYSQIAAALASRYEVIYYVNVETNAYRVYSSGTHFAHIGTATQGDDFFLAIEMNIRKTLHPDDCERMVQEMKKPRLMRHLGQSRSLTLNFRQVVDGAERYLSAIIVRPVQDICHIVVAVADVDTQTRREQSMLTENETFGEIAKALAQRYEAIYHVNIQTNEYTEYTASEEFAKLGVGRKGQDFFLESQQNMKRDIYPEDYPMMAQAMKKERLLETIRETGKTFLNYRLMLDGRPQYVTLFAVRPKEDSSHIIVAVANVDDAHRNSFDYEAVVDSARDMANRDALTGVKNKRAYVQTEMEIDEQITEQKNPAFAVVICDVNGLKEINDSKGHKAGDTFIQNACHIICDTFKHSPVFRIGGDEFTVILRGTDYEHRQQLMQKLTIIMLEHMQSGKVTLASGLSVFDKSQDMRVQDVFERADSAMYENKKRFKKQMRR
ncbi:MAG: GGDEF domain-containing protein [Oscillospiraceae bacterium]|nr:GGDEF domain-containing protein [Oscillospiraceae bacterium]